MSDEVEAGLCSDAARRLDVDLIIAAGDLPFGCLTELSDHLDRTQARHDSREVDLLLTHEHIHPDGQPVPDRFLGGVRVVNVVGRRILEF